MSVLRYIVRVTLRKQVELVALVAVGTTLALAPIHLFRTVLDTAIPRRDETLLLQVGALLVVMVVARVFVNYRQTVVSEQIRQGFTGELRGRLFAHVIRLSPEFFAKHSVGNLVHRVQLEVGRLGMSVAWIFIEPLVHTATALVYVGYLLSMSVPLTLLSLAGLPLVLLFAPRINRRLAENERTFTGLIGAYVARMTEGFAGIYEVQAHATYPYETGRLDAQQDRVSRNRVDGARASGWLDVLSELTRGLGPILVYTYGALLAIAGRMTVGQIVAFTGTLGGLYLALDKLVKYPPQLRNAQDRFDELSELWDIPQAFVDRPALPAGPSAEAKAADPSASEASRRAVPITLEKVTFGYDAKEPLLRDLSLELAPGEHVVLVGKSGCGKSTVLGLVAGRLTPRAGEVRLEGRALASEPAGSLGRTIGTVGQHPFLFHTTLRNNLLYALLRRPADGDEVLAYADLAPLGLEPEHDDDAIDAKLVAACSDVGLDDELLEFGLEARLSASSASSLLAIRATVAEALAGDAAVERFDPNRYITRAAVRENLRFAPAEELRGSGLKGQRMDGRRLESELRAARQAGVSDLLAEIGFDDANADLAYLLRVRETSVAMLVDLGVDPDDLSARERLVERVARRARTEASLDAETFRVLCERGLGARTSDDSSRSRIVAAREPFARALGASAPEPYDRERWHPSMNVRDNLLFGRIDVADVRATRRAHDVLRSALAESGSIDRVRRLGLDFEVGEKGARLSGGQRQKVSIARVLLKGAPVLLLDEATASLDKRSAIRVQELLAERWRGRTLVAITHDLVLADRFDRVVVFDKGRVVEDGRPSELLAREGPFRQLYDAATAGSET
ncbi:MAG: ABC transporter ATP-binding protein/permease [Deltaproteobacteria bacterium]|nr:ABC transporter ATP-binding protein/permease [Deltaproteobacteria bacterium]